MFENPRVTDGLVRKTSKFVSKGIGAGYVGRMGDYHRLEHVPLKFPVVQYKYEADLPEDDDMPKSFEVEFTDEYLAEVYKNLRCHVTGKKSVSFSMPKYWKSKILGDKVLRYVSYEFGIPINHSKTERSSLSLALSNYVRKRVDAIYFDKFFFILAEHPTWTSSQIHHTLIMDAAEDLERRESDARKALAKFYDKSRL